MSDVICGCCGEYPCTYGIEVQDKFAEATKCGVVGNVETAPPHYYKTVTTLTQSPDSSNVQTYTPNADGGCDFASVPATPLGATDDCPTQDADDVTETHTGTHCTSGADSGDPTSSIDLTEEDTTAALEARLDTMITGEDWDPSGSVAPQFFLADDESFAFKAINRFRLNHAPPASLYLKAWYRLTQVPDVGDPSVGGWIEFYSWDGTSSPFGGCTDGTDQCLHSAWIEIDAPTSNGSITIDFAVSCDSSFAPT